MKSRLLGPLEGKVMAYYWGKSHPATIADLCRYLNQNKKCAYTTVATVVGRLMKKGLLSREERSGQFFYAPKLSQDEYLKSRSRGLAKTLLGSFGDIAIASFVEEVRDDPESLRILRELTSDRQ